MGDLPLPVYDEDDKLDTIRHLSHTRNMSVPSIKAMSSKETQTLDVSTSATNLAAGHGTTRSSSEWNTHRVEDGEKNNSAMSTSSDQYNYATHHANSQRGKQVAPAPSESTAALFHDGPFPASSDKPTHRWSPETQHDMSSSHAIAALLSINEPTRQKDNPHVLPPLRTQRSFSYADIHPEGYAKGIPLDAPEEMSQERSATEADSRTASSSPSESPPLHQAQRHSAEDDRYHDHARLNRHQQDQDRHVFNQHRHQQQQQQHQQQQHQQQHQHQHQREHSQPQHHPVKQHFSPMQPQLQPQPPPALSSRPVGAYESHRPRWEPSYLPPVGPQREQQPYWPSRDHALSAYASPTIDPRFGAPQQPPYPPHVAGPPPEIPYYASPRPLGRPPIAVSFNPPPPGSYVPVVAYPPRNEPARIPAPPPRVDKQSQASAKLSSQRHARSARARRRRHGSRHSESMDARISSVALITPSYGPSVSLDTRSSESQERPPGGWYWAVMGDMGNSGNEDADDENLSHDPENTIMLPIQMCQPPLHNIMPPYPQALEADPQPRLRKQSKYTPQQDRLILELKSNGETWAEIAAKANCHNQLAARNRYQVLIGQQGSGTFFWTEEDCAALQSSLDEAERAKWLHIAQELTRKRGRQFSLDAVHLKITQMFAAHPETFGVIKTQDASRGGAPYKRKLLEDG